VAVGGGLAVVVVVAGAVAVVGVGGAVVVVVVVVVVVGGAVVLGCAGCDAFVAFVRRVLSVCRALTACGREDPQAANVISGRVTPAMARART
jgi:hypothetical protein